MLKRKIITFFLLLSFITPFFYLPSQAPRAHAVFGFGDLVIDIKALAERIVDGIAMALAQQIIDRMVASTVKWAQTGFDGNPAYAVDPRQYFTDIADGVAGDFVRGSDLSYLCSPFQANIKLSLVQQYYNPQPFQCTLTDVVENIEGFYDSFSQGGWDAWFSLTQNETNNPYGAYLKAKIELDSRIASKVGLENQQLDWNQGFLSWKVDCPAAQTVTAAQAAEWANDPEMYNHQGLPYKAGDCLDNNLKVATPGSTIKAQLDKVLPSGLDKLITAQHVDQLVSAFATGLLQKFVFGPDGLFSKKSNPDKMQSGGAKDIDGDGVPDGMDNTGDGVLDICYFGGTTSTAGPPCLGSTQATSTTPPTGGGQCNATGNSYSGALRSAMDAVLAERPDVANLPNTEAGGRQNARTFLALVETKLISMGYNATDDVLNGNNNPNTGDLIAVWGEGDDNMERYDAIIGSAATIAEASVADQFTGFVPLNCTSSGGGRDCGCNNDGGEGSFPGSPPTSLLPDLQEERKKYGTPMTEEELGKLLNAVAWNNRSDGWVLVGKASGTNCPSPAGPRISCDFLLHRPTLMGYDVLIGQEAEATPTWQGPDETLPGLIQDGSRTFVNPVAP
jgi:hypothetical protein